MTTATAIRERPVLFSGPMVRAILDGRKTQTRRVVKFNEHPWIEPFPHVEYARDGMPIWFDSAPSRSIRESDYFDSGYPCPYGRVGDRLWVRETFRIYGRDRGEGFEGGIEYRADMRPRQFVEFPEGIQQPAYLWCKNKYFSGKANKWMPAIHMCGWASRITLEITGVKLERLTSISSSDCIAEGLLPTMRNETPAKDRYSELWDSINGKRPGCAWSDNPWVWALTFKVVKLEPTT